MLLDAVSGLERQELHCANQALGVAPMPVDVRTAGFRDMLASVAGDRREPRASFRARLDLASRGQRRSEGTVLSGEGANGGMA